MADCGGTGEPDRVTGDPVRTAIGSAGRNNPMLDIGIGQHGADTAHLLTTTGPAMAGLIDAVGAASGATERRVAGSLVVLGYAARLVGPVVSVLARDAILLDVRPTNVGYDYRTGRGFRLTLRTPAGWRGAPLDGWRRVVVDAQLRPLVTSVRSVVPVSADLLWGNVASGLVGALRALAADGTVPVEACHRIGLSLLAAGPLAGTGELCVEGDTLRFTRRSCCLYYRINGGMCGDCALLPDAGRT